MEWVSSQKPVIGRRGMVGMDTTSLSSVTDPFYHLFISEEDDVLRPLFP
jgi:hypothetical protein